MSRAILKMAAALPAVERARLLLAQARAGLSHARSLPDYLRVRSVAEAVKVLSKTIEHGREIACEAGEIIVVADTGRARCEAELRAERPKGRPRNGHPRGDRSHARVVAEGKRAPLVALGEADRRVYFRACREALEPPTTAGAVALARLQPEQRKQVLASLGDDPEPTAAIRRVRIESARAKAAEQLRALPTKAVIRLQDAFAFLQRLPEESADLLLTDPPYSTDVDDVAAFAASWLPLALSRLNPDAHAIVFVGAYPAELHAYLSLDLGLWRIEQVLVWSYTNTLGPKPRQDYLLTWQAILHIRGEHARPINSPLLTEQLSVHQHAHPARSAARLHRWQKPLALAEMFVRHLTSEGQLVVDPFAGSGTSLVAAASLGRRAIGCDIDPRAVGIALDRGCIDVDKETPHAAE